MKNVAEIVKKCFTLSYHVTYREILRQVSRIQVHEEALLYFTLSEHYDYEMQHYLSRSRAKMECVSLDKLRRIVKNCPKVEKENEAGGCISVPFSAAIQLETITRSRGEVTSGSRKETRRAVHTNNGNIDPLS
eukprot:TRINITY_DN5753_c0_g1_i1.p2 TRINITY_DN5753_c0_g1~~TRINITY_DN5753_c0_g1_i1.p2  ORF type:complete len:133 (+),score=18.63 TRINITY_DN5753_c0_g1_i1:285-683(+)